jgi:hypothetical protein
MSDRSMLIRSTLAITFGAMLAASAAPALAMEKPANSNEAVPAESQPEPAERKYCLSTTLPGEPIVTGSAPKRQCLTRDQWTAKGITFKAR